MGKWNLTRKAEEACTGQMVLRVFCLMCRNLKSVGGGGRGKNKKTLLLKNPGKPLSLWDGLGRGVKCFLVGGLCTNFLQKRPIGCNMGGPLTFTAMNWTPNGGDLVYPGDNVPLAVALWGKFSNAWGPCPDGVKKPHLLKPKTHGDLWGTVWAWVLL